MIGIVSTATLLKFHVERSTCSEHHEIEKRRRPRLVFLTYTDDTNSSNVYTDLFVLSPSLFFFVFGRVTTLAACFNRGNK